MLGAVKGHGRVKFSTQPSKKNRMIFTLFMLINILIFLAMILAKWPLPTHLKWGRVTAGAIQSRIYHDNRLGPYIICPKDPTLARQENCHFDLLANGWIPSPCFDSAMHHDFVDGKNYGFFEDVHGVRAVHQNTIMEGDISRYPDGLFVTFNEHFEHCRYILNGSSRAMVPPFTGILDDFRDSGHLQHCIGVLSESRDPLHIETTVKAYFTSHRCYLSIKPELGLM
ncbi:hypothetical protein G7Y89_g6027 [Cudoniella acicularis]|uniref:Uncharacterized protein n=1 Tax=Cudoniella acicularis TaxID=354080 RepID=A0A8H4RN05_9HELO|nr:hypothetical protein G7Y89_g6027 [Cudoniella acicularis]